MQFLDKGFTLIEVLFTVGILAFVLCGLLVTYINMFFLGDIARQTTLAANAAQAKLEDLKRVSFTNLPAFNGTTFDIAGFTAANAKGRIEVSNTAYDDLKEVRIVVSFRQKGQRIIGEDTSLNGILDSGEDDDGNGRLDSPIEVVTTIAR